MGFNRKDTKENIIERVMEMLPKRCKDKEIIKQYCDILYCLGYQEGFKTAENAV